MLTRRSLAGYSDQIFVQVNAGFCRDGAVTLCLLEIWRHKVDVRIPFHSVIQRRRNRVRSG
jgi:hypothetical protein